MVKPGAPPHGCGTVGEVMGRGGLVHTPRRRWETADWQSGRWRLEMIRMNDESSIDAGAGGGAVSGHANRS